MKIITYILLLGGAFLLWSCGQSDEEIMKTYGTAKEEAMKVVGSHSAEELVSVPFSEYDRQIKVKEKDLFGLLGKLHSDTLRDKEMRQLKLELDAQRFMYVWALRNVKKLGLDSDVDFVNYARAIDLNDPALVRDDMGKMVCDMRLRWEMGMVPGTWNGRQLDYLNIIKKFITNQEVRNKVTTAYVESYFSSGGNERIKEVFAFYTELCNDRADIERLTPRYEELTVLSAGSPAPDFEMADPQGKTFRLSDFKGKFVMIDVWATWCGPCKMQTPYFERQHELFASDPRICFIAISLDENKEAWKKMLENEKPKLKQFVVEKGIKSDLCTRYFISAIPRFLLIDPQGRIVSVDVMRPADDKFTEYIRECVQN